MTLTGATFLFVLKKMASLTSDLEIAEIKLPLPTTLVLTNSEGCFSEEELALKLTGETLNQSFSLPD